MDIYIYVISIFILLIVIFWAGSNYFLKSALDHYSNNKEGFENLTDASNQSIRPIDECSKRDLKEQNILFSPSSGGIPDAPFKYVNYVGEIYREIPNETLGKDNGIYCIKKPKLLYDGIWEPYIFAKNGNEKTEWSLTDGNLFEGDICMKSLYNTLKPMPKYLPADCPPMYDTTIGVYCNGPVMNDPQDITSPIDSQVIAFPSIFTPGLPGESPIQNTGF